MTFILVKEQSLVCICTAPIVVWAPSLSRFCFTFEIRWTYKALGNGNGEELRKMRVREREKERERERGRERDHFVGS